jgi:hypothetical protein
MNCREKTIGRLFIWSATDGTRFYLMRTTVLKTQQSAPPGGPSNCFWGSLREVLESASHFGGLGPHALAWTRRKAPTHIVHFEVLIGNPGKELDRAIDALAQGASLSVMRRCPLFKSGTTQCRGSFERERSGSWCEEMPRGLQDLFWRHHREAMEALGYTAPGRGLAYFFSPNYERHNRAVLGHLQSLGLPLSNCRVLELGRGPVITQASMFSAIARSSLSTPARLA